MKTREESRAVQSTNPQHAHDAHKKPGRSAALFLGISVLMVAGTVMAGPVGVGGKRSVDTMQANLYVGGGIDRVVALDPTNPGYLTNLLATVTGVYYEIVASQPQVRLQGIAQEIAARMPDIVSVEEGSLIRNQSPGDLVFGGTTPATNVVFDYLQILVDSLQARGAHYAVAAVTYGFDAEMPMLNLLTGTIDDVRLTDREAILVRTDLPPGQFHVTNPQGGNFQNVVVVPGTGLRLLYGWCSVDVFVRGENFRYICAHLTEESAPQIQVLEAAELLQGPANVPGPVMLVGDFNADPFQRDGSIAYDLFPAAGFLDAWTTVHPDQSAGGLTWGHDEFLANLTHPFDRRIDLVFYRGSQFVPASIEVIDPVLQRQTPPLWASDHTSITAQFRLGSPVEKHSAMTDK